MRAVITNFGSTGDVLPFVALAVELRRHGHQPILAFAPNIAASVARFGLPFVPIGPDLDDALRAMISTRVEMTEFLGSVNAIREFLAPVAAALPQIFADLREVCRDADVLISGPTQPAARIVHEHSGIPFASVYIYHPGSVGTPAMHHARLSYVNPFRQQLGLPPLHDPVTSHHSPQLALYAMSRHVIPPAASWPLHYQMPGYFFLDEDWQPDPGLAEFIAAGEPPVVFTFGSMIHDDPTAMTALTLEAIEAVGCRAIIQQGWSGLGQQQLPPRVYPLGFAAHRWLFPRAACVVHHGGAGTAGAAFRAGVPSVFVPHAADQPLWAETAEELGCAGPSVPYPELSAARLAEAIATTLAEPRYREAAADLGTRIRSEHGVQKARQLIEQLVAQIGGQGGDSEPPAEQGSRRRALQQRQRLRRNTEAEE